MKLKNVLILIMVTIIANMCCMTFVVAEEESNDDDNGALKIETNINEETKKENSLVERDESMGSLFLKNETEKINRIVEEENDEVYKAKKALFQNGFYKTDELSEIRKEIFVNSKTDSQARNLKIEFKRNQNNNIISIVILCFAFVLALFCLLTKRGQKHEK